MLYKKQYLSHQTEMLKMMEKEIDDFYLWQSSSSFLSDYFVEDCFQKENASS